MKTIFNQMMIIYYAIMTGHILFACILVFAIKPVVNPGLDINLFLGVTTAISVSAIIGSFFLYQLRVKKIKEGEGDTEMKMTAWRTEAIIRIAMMEAPCLLNLIFFLLSGSSVFLYMYVACALIMLYYRPKYLMVLEELGLESER